MTTLSRADLLQRSSDGARMASDELRTVFVSYTSELAKYPEKPYSYIDAVLRGIQRAGFLAKHMHDYEAEDRAAAEVNANHVRGCDVYLGVIGLRWGSPVLDQPDVSYTQHEFRTATEFDKPRLIFVLNETRCCPFLQDCYGMRRTATAKMSSARK